MKRIACIIMIIVLLFALVSCSGKDNKDNKYVELVNQAIDLLKTEWSKVYREADRPEAIEDYYLEIKNTSVIIMKENDNESFKDIEKIVDFLILDNYYDFKPSLYQYNYIYHQVIFYRDGHTEVPQIDVIKQAYRKTYETDFSDVIERVEDLNDSYNAVYHLDQSGEADENKALASKDGNIDQAVKLLKQQWMNIYQDEKHPVEDGYLEIKNTRVIKIKENDTVRFSGIDKIVDFLVLDNYLNIQPSFYKCCNIYQQVIFYRDGHTEVPSSNIFTTYYNKVWDADFRQIIESTEDFGNSYNAVYHL